MYNFWRLALFSAGLAYQMSPILFQVYVPTYLSTQGPRQREIQLLWSLIVSPKCNIDTCKQFRKQWRYGFRKVVRGLENPFIKIGWIPKMTPDTTWRIPCRPSAVCSAQIGHREGPRARRGYCFLSRSWMDGCLSFDALHLNLLNNWQISLHSTSRLGVSQHIRVWLVVSWVLGQDRKMRR